jgi:hypothetical protein
MACHRDLSRLHRKKYQGPVEVFVTSSNTIYETEVEELLFGKVSLFDMLGVSGGKEVMHSVKTQKVVSQYGSNDDLTESGNEESNTPCIRDHGSEDSGKVSGETTSTQTSHVPVSIGHADTSTLNMKLKEISSKSLRAHESLHDPLLHPPRNEAQEEWPCGLVIVVPVRLGIDSVNPEYYEV